MKFSIRRDLFVKSLNDVMKAISIRTTIPILTGIKISVTEEGITLTGSDSDISIESFIPVDKDDFEKIKIEETGSVVLQARFFHDIIRKLPENIVDIEVNEQFQTVIKSGKAKFNLNGLDPEEYPLLPQITGNKSFSIPTDLLKTLIQQTVFAVSTSEVRPILTGVNFSVVDNELTCIATDSHRLAYRKALIETDGESDDEYNIVVPGKSLNELSKILDDSNDLVKVVITENQILFKTEYLLFYSRLLEGNYPDTKRLIPSDSMTNITVETKSFLQAVDRASLLSKDEKSNVVKLSTTSNETVEISSNTPEIGNVIEQIYCDEITGEELIISFSAKYMMDALKVIDGSEINISFTGAMRPFVIRPLNNDSIIQLILPVRTF